MSWPRTLPARTCADCEGLLVDDRVGAQPVFTWALQLDRIPPYWQHHRRAPEAFDLGTAERFECSRCERVTILGAKRLVRGRNAPLRVLRRPTRRRLSTGHS